MHVNMPKPVRPMRLFSMLSLVLFFFSSSAVLQSIFSLHSSNSSTSSSSSFTIVGAQPLGGQGGQPREVDVRKSRRQRSNKGGGGEASGLDFPLTLSGRSNSNNSSTSNVMDHGTFNRYMYWVPNQAGLFSHFLQLKAIYEISNKVQRKLMIVPTTSPHYGEVAIDMCTVFALPDDIGCVAPPSTTFTSAHTDAMKKQLDCRTVLPTNYDDLSQNQDFCYSGTIKFSADKKARSYVLKAVEYKLPMIFNSSYLADVPIFETAMGVAGSSSGNNKDNNNKDNSEYTYTVVHWRRGDQLESRCVNKIDETVNCGSALDLIQRVRNISNDKVVYVATNEKQNSKQMEILRKEGGFRTFSDVASTSFSSIDSFHMVVLEAMLMIKASTFLGWGVSEINDLVEFERKKLGKTYCVDQYEIRYDAQLTWCGLATANAAAASRTAEKLTGRTSNANLHKEERRANKKAAAEVAALMRKYDAGREGGERTGEEGERAGGSAASNAAHQNTVSSTITTTTAPQWPSIRTNSNVNGKANNAGLVHPLAPSRVSNPIFQSGNAAQ